MMTLISLITLVFFSETYTKPRFKIKSKIGYYREKLDGQDSMMHVFERLDFTDQDDAMHNDLKGTSEIL